MTLGCPPPGAGLHDENEGQSEQAGEETAPQVVVRRRRPRRPPPKRLRDYPDKKADDSDGGRLPQMAGVTDQQWFNRPDMGGSDLPSRPGLSHQQALERIWSELADATELGPTEICWLVDVSPSASEWHPQLIESIAGYYGQLTSQRPAVAKNLVTRIGVFSDSFDWLTAEPNGEAGEVAKLWQSLPQQPSNRENVFAAVEAAIEPLRTSRLKQRKEVLIVIITDEAGNDGDRLLKVLPSLKKYGIPVYTIGLPAPFGRRTVVWQNTEGGEMRVPLPSKKAVIVHGP